MKTVRFLAVALVLLLPALVALATPPSEVTDGTANYQWTQNDWCKVGDQCMMELDLDWFRPISAVAQDAAWSMYGYMPIDPIVSEKVRNRTSGDVWNDFHIKVVNGRVDPSSVRIYRYSPPAPVDWFWFINPLQPPDPDGDQIDAFADPLATVGPGQILSVYFVFNPIDPNLPVTITEWPTKDFIPEPSSIAGLTMCLAAMGFTLRRRLR